MPSKSEARKKLLSREITASSDDFDMKRLTDILQTQSGRVVLLYLPVASWNEIDISSLPGLLPNVQFDFLKNKKDVPLPKKKYDVVLVPLLGFNEQGFRLGHGGGWYDRFLATQPTALKIGVGHEDTLVDFEPEPYDVRMDILVTEQQTRDFRVQ